MFVQVTPSLSLYYDLLYNTVNSSLKSRNVYIVNIGERRSYLQFFLESQIINIFKNAIQIEGQWGWGVSTHTSWHKQFQIGLKTSECTIYRLFSFFLQFRIVSHPVTMHALETFFFFWSSKSIQLSSGLRIHHLPSLFSNCSLQFQIVSNTVTMHALETFFFLQFQIISDTVRMHA